MYRHLGKAFLGIYSLGFVTASLIRTLIDGGYEVIIPVESAKNNRLIDDIIKEASCYKNIIWLISLMPAFILGILSSPGNYSFVVLLFWNITGTSSSTYKAALRGLGAMKEVSKLDLTINIIMYSISAALIYVCSSVSIMFSVFLIAEIVRTFAAKYVLERKLSRKVPSVFYLPKLNETIKLIKMNFAYISMNFLSSAVFRLPLYMLGSLSGAAAAGNYTSAMRFVTASRILPGAMQNALIPTFAESIVKNGRAGLLPAVKVSLVLGAALSLALYFASDWLMTLIYGTNEAAYILKILVLLLMPLVLNYTMEAYWLAKGKEEYIIYVLSFVLVSALAVSFITIPIWGDKAAAWIAFGAEILTSIIGICLILYSRIKVKVN